MNFMGMGMLELGVVLVVAFIVLGPSRSIDMARTAGKVIGELRRTFADLTAAVSLEQRQEQESREPEPPAGPEGDSSTETRK